MKNKIQCKICNKEFDYITSSHLKKHGLTMKKYKEKYPNIVKEEIKC